MRNTSESGTSGDAKVSNDKMAKLLRDRRPALEAIFPPDGVNRLGMVARSLELNNRDVTAGTIKASAADRARDISHALGDKLSHSVPRRTPASVPCWASSCSNTSTIPGGAGDRQVRARRPSTG